MNITKTLAEEVADKMVEPLKKKINDLCEKRTQIADEAIRKYIPKEVLGCFANHRSYFSVSYRVTLRSASCEKRVDKVTCFPHCNTYYPYIETDIETIEKVDKIDLEIESIEDETNKLYNSVVSTLLALRTFKRAKENFPEAYKYMSQYEEACNTAIALPIDNIMNALKKYSV